MTEFARQLKEFLDAHAGDDLTVEELNNLFFATHKLPDVSDPLALEREVLAVTELINTSNFQDIMYKLGLGD